MPRTPSLFVRLSRAIRRRFERAQRELRRATTVAMRPPRVRRAAATERAPVGLPGRQYRRAATPGLKRRRSPRLLEQLAFDLGPERPRWQLSRLVAASPHQTRILEHVEFARRFFPEFDGVTIRLGLAQKRGVLGWGSLDPDRPGIWVRPRRLHLFTIAHEFTHLLQARGLVPRGERQCDLWALSRSPLLVDSAPGYLKLPRALRRGALTSAQAHALYSASRVAIEAREHGDRRYLIRFESAVAEALAGTGA